MPLRANDFAVQELREVSLVVDLREAVEDREPVDLLVILGLDIPAREVAVNAVPDAQVVAVLEQRRRFELPVVDERSVRTPLIVDVVALGGRLDPGVPPGDGVILQTDVAVLAATENDDPVRQRIPATHVRASRVDVDETRLARDRGEEPFRRRYPGFCDFVAHSQPVRRSGGSPRGTLRQLYVTNGTGDEHLCLGGKVSRREP